MLFGRGAWEAACGRSDSQRPLLRASGSVSACGMRAHIDRLPACDVRQGINRPLYLDVCTVNAGLWPACVNLDRWTWSAEWCRVV